MDNDYNNDKTTNSHKSDESDMEENDERAIKNGKDEDEYSSYGQDDYVADFGDDVNAILSAYAKKPEKILQDKPIVIPRVRKPRDAEWTLFTLPKVRSNANLRVASQQQQQEQLPYLRYGQAPLFSSNTKSQQQLSNQRRVVTESAVTDLHRMNTVTKSFMSDLSILDGIGDFDSLALDTLPVLPDLSEPKINDSNNLLLREFSVVRKPLPVVKSSSDAVVIEDSSSKASEIENLELTENQTDEKSERQENIKSLNAKTTESHSTASNENSSSLSILKLPPIRSMIYIDEVKSPVVESIKKTVPRKPVPHGTGKIPVFVQQGKNQQDFSLPLKTLPKSPGQMKPNSLKKHSYANQTSGKLSESPVRFDKKELGLKDKFRDLMQMDAMGVTPSSRANVKTIQNRHGLKLNFKSFKTKQKEAVTEGVQAMPINGRRQPEPLRTAKTVNSMNRPSVAATHSKIPRPVTVGSMASSSSVPASLILKTDHMLNDYNHDLLTKASITGGESPLIDVPSPLSPIEIELRVNDLIAEDGVSSPVLTEIEKETKIDIVDSKSSASNAYGSYEVTKELSDDEPIIEYFDPDDIPNEVISPSSIQEQDESLQVDTELSSKTETERKDSPVESVHFIEPKHSTDLTCLEELTPQEKSIQKDISKTQYKDQIRLRRRSSMPDFKSILLPLDVKESLKTDDELPQADVPVRKDSLNRKTEANTSNDASSKPEGPHRHKKSTSDSHLPTGWFNDVDAHQEEHNDLQPRDEEQIAHRVPMSNRLPPGERYQGRDYLGETGKPGFAYYQQPRPRMRPMAPAAMGPMSFGPPHMGPWPQYGQFPPMYMYAYPQYHTGYGRQGNPPLWASDRPPLPPSSSQQSMHQRSVQRSPMRGPAGGRPALPKQQQKILAAHEMKNDLMVPVVDNTRQHGSRPYGDGLKFSKQRHYDRPLTPDLMMNASNGMRRPLTPEWGHHREYVSSGGSSGSRRVYADSSASSESSGYNRPSTPSKNSPVMTSKDFMGRMATTPEIDPSNLFPVKYQYGRRG
ncbi:hypothetical protein V1514DRAFT_336545 [Lipomyces japonicus]|uniref:uncharacterized protein n=1 Tax=Lipomyces japonicus TaxID=56871 RepID=UPI0034CE9B5E